MKIEKGSILLLTKDAQCLSYFPCYGNKYYSGKTPNLDELVQKGTKFNNCFTVAPSSVMSYWGMFSGKYPYELPMKAYLPVKNEYKGVTLFDKANELGFETHVYWDEHWYKMAYIYTKCYGKNTQIHYLTGLRQGVGPHYKRSEYIKRDDDTAMHALRMVRSEMDALVKQGRKIFVWFHLPHVLNGRTGYGDDIDLFDQYIGMFREYFDDSNIFISADHGNMNGSRGKLRYGFDVYDSAIRIPLVTPRIDNMEECDTQMTNKDFFDLVFNRRVVTHEFLVVDSTYYAQPRRKTAIVYGKYRYIYNKQNKSEELYDIEWDPNQNFNLISDWYYDIDRNQKSLSREMFFYPEWDKLPDVREKLRKTRLDIWRDAGFLETNVLLLKSKIRKNSLVQKYILPIFHSKEVK